MALDCIRPGALTCSLRPQGPQVKWSMTFLAVLGILAQAITGCAGFRKEAPKEVQTSGDKAPAAANPPEEVSVTGDSRVFTYSLSNSTLSGFVVDKRRAETLAESLADGLKKPEVKDRKELVALMTARRFAGAKLSDVVNVAIKLMSTEMKKDLKRDLPETAKLELVLTAIKARRLAFAEHFIPELKESKDKSIRAAAFTAEGIISLLDGRLPEAVYAWNEALKVDGDYQPALLNVGLTAMRYGDVQTAKKRLSSNSNEPAVVAALITSDRITGHTAKVDEICKEALTKHRDYRPILYNCALNSYQGLGNLDQAEQLLKEVGKNRSEGGVHDEMAERILIRIEDERLAKAKSGAAKPAESEAKPEQGNSATPKKAVPAPSDPKQP